MKKILLISAFAVLMPSVAMAQMPKISEPFTSKIPDTFTLQNNDGRNVISANFATGYQPQNTWYWGKATIDEPNKSAGIPAALSCSHRVNPALPTYNWMILPPLKVKDNTILTWTAKSLHFDLRESYEVKIATKDTTNPEDFETIYTVTDENYFFTRHVIDLSAYTGKSCRIAFVHNSTFKFILAIGEIFAGTPTTAYLEGKNVGIHAFGIDDEPYVAVELHNCGATITLNELKITNTDKKITAGIADGFPITLATNEKKVVYVPVDVTLHEGFKYNAVATDNANKTYTLFSDVVSQSYFRRKMFIEKYTGFWCSTCPNVWQPTHRSINRLHPSEVVYVEAHQNSGNTDDVAADSYVSGVPFKLHGDYPSLWYNRTQLHNTYNSTTLDAFEAAMKLPCDAEINTKINYKNGDNYLTATAYVRFAQDIDNTDNRMRVGFTVVEDNVELPATATKQANHLAGDAIEYGECSFMAHPVASYFNIMNNVVRDSPKGGSGLTGSLPDFIEADKTYTFTTTVDMPAAPHDVSNIGKYSLVSTIVDHNSPTYEVHNATINPIVEDTMTGVVAVENNAFVVNTSNGIDVVLPANEAWTVNAYGIDGTALGTYTGIGTKANLNLDNRGVIILDIRQGNLTKTVKLMK